MQPLSVLGEALIQTEAEKRTTITSKTVPQMDPKHPDEIHQPHVALASILTGMGMIEVVRNCIATRTKVHMQKNKTLQGQPSIVQFCQCSPAWYADACKRACVGHADTAQETYIRCQASTCRPRRNVRLFFSQDTDVTNADNLLLPHHPMQLETAIDMVTWRICTLM